MAEGPGRWIERKFHPRRRARDGVGGLQNLFSRWRVERDGVRGEEGAELAAFLKVLETRVQYFLDAPELGAPQVPHVVETLINGGELRIYVRGKERHHDAC